jgi:hypothetical protein
LTDGKHAEEASQREEARGDHKQASQREEARDHKQASQREEARDHKQASQREEARDHTQAALCRKTNGSETFRRVGTSHGRLDESLRGGDTGDQAAPNA